MVMIRGMKRFIGMGLVSALVTALFPCMGLCQKAGPTAKPEVIKPQGTVTFGFPSLGDEVWLMATRAPWTTGVQAPMYNFLVVRAQNSPDFEPSLATSWRMSKDGLTWTFDLRKGVQFHGGWGEFTAEDVKFSFELALADGSLVTSKPWFKTNVKSVEVVNPYRVVFHLMTPTWNLLSHFSDHVPRWGIACKKYVESVGREKAERNPIGTGPFKFAEHRTGDYLKMEANEGYWGKVPYIKYLIFKKVPEEATRMAMLKTGDINLGAVSYEHVNDLKKAGITIKRFENAITQILLPLGQWPKSKSYDPTLPYATPDEKRNILVRKALSLAINRQEIVDNVLLGYGTSSAMGAAYFPGNPGYDPKWTPDPYDPEKAKRLLAEAGYPDPSKLRLTMDTIAHPARPFTARVAEAVAMYWMKLGINVKMQFTEWVAFEGAVIDRSAKYAMVYGWMWYEEPMDLWGIVGLDETRYLYWDSSPYRQDLVRQAIKEIDAKKRHDLQRKVGQYHYDTKVDIPIVYSDYLWGVSPGLEWPTKLGYVTSGYVSNCEYLRWTK